MAILIPKIIFDNEDFLILDKPNGLVVHPFDFSDEYTLLDFLQEKFPQIFDIKNEKKLQDGRIINLGGIVHKLDRETSGIMVIAKNQKTFDELSKQFKNHQVKKVYIAKVVGRVDLTGKTCKNLNLQVLPVIGGFIIDAPLGREKKSYRQIVNPQNRRGELRSAITEVKVIKSNDNFSLVELSPRTGRTHQLRAHMLHIGHPIMGDKVYGLPAMPAQAGQTGNKNDNSERLMLHAKSLEFILDGERYFFEVEIPKLFDFL